MNSRRPLPTKLGRVALFWAGYVLILVVVAFAKGLVPAAAAQLVWGLLSAAAIVLLTHVLMRGEGAVLADYGLQLQSGSGRRLLLGIAIGVGNYLLAVLITSLLLGRIHFEPATAVPIGTILLSVCTVLALATMEELGFRGYPLRTLVAAIGAWPAQIVVAFAFALIHLGYGWPWQTVLLGVLPSALLFGAAALASGGLALPIGVHAGMNLARWAAGETEIPRFWTWVIAGPADAHFANGAMLTGLAGTLLTTALLWLWHWHRAAS